MTWSVRYDQNGSTLAHYGVKGMRWGVRNDKEKSSKTKRSYNEQKKETIQGGRQRAAVEGGYSNIQRLTDSVKRQNNGDGSFNISGLKGISRAYFKNETAYQNWLNGRTNLLSGKGKSFNNALTTKGPKWDATNNRYTDGPYYISVDSSNTPNPNDPDFELYFDDPEEYFEALNDLKVQIADQESASKYDTSISKLSNKKTNSKSVAALADKGADAVKKALDRAGKVIAAAGKAAGKKAAELADKGKKALEKLLNIKPGPVKITSLDDLAKAEKSKREKRNRNQVSVVYDYGAKTVTASPNASLSKVVKKLGGSTKGWKLQTK